MKNKYIVLNDSGITALINPLNGQLVSLFLRRELIHPGGRFSDDPKKDIDGWANSGLIMFPIVSASKDNVISYDGKKYALDQHGMIRSLVPICSLTNDVKLKMKTINRCIVKYHYKKNAKVNNIKYVKNKDTKSINPKVMHLPFSFDLSEEYYINAKEKRLEITTSIKNTSKKTFCYALGRHPAFILDSNNYMDCAFYDSNGKEVITLPKLIELSKASAYIMHGVKSVIAHDNHSKKGVRVWTDFGNIMLWSPKENMFCIEPITDRVGNNDIELDLSSRGSYRDLLYPDKTKKYHTMIMIEDKKK